MENRKGKPMSYSDIAEALTKAVPTGHWAIAMEAVSLAQLAMPSAAIDREARAKAIRATSGRVAIINVEGVITQRAWWMGTTTEEISAAFSDAMDSSDISAIVLRVNSPGGSVYGVQELADQIYISRGGKQIIAVADSMAASAAYWLGTAADQLVVTPSGDVGSVGVFAMHVDWSKANEQFGVKPTYIYAGKYKVEGNPDEPLGAEAKASIQDSVNATYDAFVQSVARHRGVTASAVRSGFGQGRLVDARAAKEIGMADRVESFRDVLSKLAGTMATKKSPMRAEQMKLMRLNKERRNSYGDSR